MNITTNFLKKIDACDESIKLYNNTKLLHKYDITKIEGISVTDVRLLDDIDYLMEKKLLNLKWLELKNGTKWYKIEYDDNGDKIKISDSGGYCVDYIKDDDGDVKLNNIVKAKRKVFFKTDYLNKVSSESYFTNGMTVYFNDNTTNIIK